MTAELAGPEAAWRAALEDGRFLLQRFPSSGNIVFPPRLFEPRTGDREMEWVEASGMGTVYSVTVIGRKPPAEADNVVLVDLDEGPRLMSRVDGVPAASVTIGMRVRARIAREDDAAIIVFDPV